MASNKNKKEPGNKANSNDKKKIKKNEFKMKILIFLGVIILCCAILYLANYFFVKKNNILINMSTDKKVEYININGKQELITTQKYVSDLAYSMRYDINKFTVFKYKNQDIFKMIDAEKILVVVEKATLPANCTRENNTTYSKCSIEVDAFTEETYISNTNETYKLTVKTPNNARYDNDIQNRINYMLDSFEMTL